MSNSLRSEFADKIELNGIPYVIIYDKNGNLAEINAPYQSDPKLKELLNKYLND